MTYLEQQSQKIEVTQNKIHPLKPDRTSELEELITYLVNYLRPRILSDLQETVVRSAWSGKTYIEISEETYNDPDYLKGVGAKVWHILSEALGEEVTKRNIKLVSRRNYKKLQKFNRNCQQELNNIPKVTNLHDKTTKSCNKAVTNKYRDWGEAVDVAFFYGRLSELAKLKQWLIKDCCRLIAILGMGGIGKTSLAVKLARQVESEFEVVIWKSLRNLPEFKSILTELIIAICDRQTLYVADTIDGQINNLMNCLRQKRCLVIFDGVDNILASGKLGGQYLENYQNYGQLLRRIQDEQHRSCVILTSREKPVGLSLREGKKSVVRSHLLKSLSIDQALKIAFDRGLIGSESTLKQLVSRCEGNPLILKMTISTIKSLFNGNVESFLEYNTILYGNIWQLIERQFQRLTPLEQQIMSYFALGKDILDLEGVLQKIGNKVSNRQLIEVLESLQGRSLIEIDQTRFIQHPIMTEYLKQSWV